MEPKLDLFQPCTTRVCSYRLPIEVIDICLRLVAESAAVDWKESPTFKRYGQRHIGLLRLVSRHFCDVLSPEMFRDVAFSLSPVPSPRHRAFLDLTRNNQSIPTYIHHLIIEFTSAKPQPDDSSLSESLEETLDLLALLSKGPLTSLAIKGLDEGSPCPAVYNGLYLLRCSPKLQHLEVSGSAVPPFLVCGHFASTQVKTIIFPTASSPNKWTGYDLDTTPQLSFDADSILAHNFQPFAQLQVLSVPNLVDIPKYFPLQDFGSAYYPSNGRIPFTLPCLTELRIGDFRETPMDAPPPLGAYKVLGALLSRAPKLETLRIVDHFWNHNTPSDFSPLTEQLPALKSFKRLDLVDLKSTRDEGLFAICNIITACYPLPALTTLGIDVQWSMGNANATRASLYLSKVWKKLQQTLLNPRLPSLHHLNLWIYIQMPWADSSRETFGYEEAEAFRESLVEIFSLGGKLDVLVEIEVED